MRTYKSKVLNEDIAIIGNTEKYEGPLVSYNTKTLAALKERQLTDNELKYIHMVQKVFQFKEERQ